MWRFFYDSGYESQYSFLGNVYSKLCLRALKVFADAFNETAHFLALNETAGSLQKIGTTGQLFVIGTEKIKLIHPGFELMQNGAMAVNVYFQSSPQYMVLGIADGEI